MSNLDPDRAGWWFLQTAVMRTAHQDVLAVIRPDMEELWARGMPYQAPEWWLRDDTTPAAAPLHERHPRALKLGLQVNVRAVERRFRDHLYEGKLVCCGRKNSSVAEYTLTPPWTVMKIESWWEGGGILRLGSGELLYNARVMPPGTKAPAPPVKNRGGRPATAIPQDVVIEVGAWLAANGVPDTLAAIERKIHDLMQAKEYDAAESTVRQCAQKLRQQHKRYQGI